MKRQIKFLLRARLNHCDYQTTQTPTFGMRLPVEGFDDADAVGLGGPAHVHDGRVEPVEDRSPEYCDSRSLWIKFLIFQVFYSPCLQLPKENVAH